MNHFKVVNLDQLQQLQHVSVRVFEGGDPTAPALLLRLADELHSRFREPAGFGMNVVHPQVGHEAEGVFGLAGDLAMPADVEPHLAQFKCDEVLVAGVER